MAGYVTIELFSSNGDLLLETDVAPQLLDHLDPEIVAEFAERFGMEFAEEIRENSADRPRGV